MIKISKSEFDLMVEKGILKCVKGKYRGLITGTKQKSGKAKVRWVEEPIFNKMMELKQKQKKEES